MKVIMTRITHTQSALVYADIQLSSRVLVTSERTGWSTSRPLTVWILLVTRLKDKTSCHIEPLRQEPKMHLFEGISILNNALSGQEGKPYSRKGGTVRVNNIVVVVSIVPDL